MDSDDDFEVLLDDNYFDEKTCRQMDEDLDRAVAEMYQFQYDTELQKSHLITESVSKPGSPHKPSSIVDSEWEKLDPTPNIFALFKQFNKDYFYGALDMVEVRWSARMTLCAGVCSYEGGGGLCSVRLSQPLLQLRPRKDLVETLLHEMIHAYLFVTCNNTDHDGHGPQFLSHMNRINRQTGTNISVYHSFHNEVDHFRKHWWKCDGPCQKRKPYYGIVKRASNRAPCSRDPWWADHQTKCGGTFQKFKEPENYGQNKKRKINTNDKKSHSKDIRSYLTPPKTKKPKTNTGNSASSGAAKNLFGGENITPNIQTVFSVSATSENSNDKIIPLPFKSNVHTTSANSKTCDQIVPFSGKGHTLGTISTKTGISRLLTKFPSESTFNSSKSDFNFSNKNSFTNFGSSGSSLSSSFSFTDKKSTSTSGNMISNRFSSFNNSSTISVQDNLRHKKSSSSGIPSVSASTGVRSKTIVINETKVSQPKENLGDRSRIPRNDIVFEGHGHRLDSNNNENNSRKTAYVTTKQKSLDNYFPKEKTGQRLKVGVIFNSDTEDEIIELSPVKKRFKWKGVDKVFPKQSSHQSNAISSANVPKGLPDLIHHQSNASSLVNAAKELPELIHHQNNAISSANNTYVPCPVCNKQVESTKINTHLDSCLS